MKLMMFAEFFVADAHGAVACSIVMDGTGGMS